MTIAHRIRRFRRIKKQMRIVASACWQMLSRHERGGLYVFRDCPTRLVVMYARNETNRSDLVDAALAELDLRLERRRIRNGWPDRSEAA